jgi:prevent-host-death family protein
MRSVSIHDAKTHLSRLVDAVQSGQVDSLVIARAGRPVARLVPFHTRRVRLGGLAAGKYVIPDPNSQEFQAIEHSIAADFEASIS